MSETRLLSVGVDNLLRRLRPYGKPTSQFPCDFDPGFTRFRSDETLVQWLHRHVNELCGGSPERCAIEEHIGVFATVYWQRGKHLSGVNICTLVTTCSLEQYLVDAPEEAEACYLRLDFDYGTLGEPFSHPLPHIHLHGGVRAPHERCFPGNLCPRFALSLGNSGNIVMAYTDFLYRQFAPRMWRAWAEAEWNQDYFQLNQPEDENPFPVLIQAFEEGQFDVLRSRGSDLAKLKRLLSKAADGMFPHFMNREDYELLDYPGGTTPELK